VGTFGLKYGNYSVTHRMENLKLVLMLSYYLLIIVGESFIFFFIPNSAHHTTHTHTHTHTHTKTNPIKYAATQPNQPQRCILTDYFITITLAGSNNKLPDDGD